MTEAQREEFLLEFERKRRQCFVGLCVLGGIFSEGIDLKEERLERGDYRRNRTSHGLY